MKIFLRPPAFIAAAVHERLRDRLPDAVVNADASAAGSADLQWADYEELDFASALENRGRWICAYCIRKALIRKHYLAACVREYVAKRPASILADAVPPSHTLELDYAEFLDDALDEAFELRGELELNAAAAEDRRPVKWFILKGGMAERGASLRLFSTQEELQQIFDENEVDSDDEDDAAASASGDDAEADDDGRVATSNMRFYVVQEYISAPLLLDVLGGRKFHIRAYVLAVGALQVYVHRNMLLLASGSVYTEPSYEVDKLGQHLTNTCYQSNTPASSENTQIVYDFWQVQDPHFAADTVHAQIKEISGELFMAASGQRIHFQAIPNAFEIYGVDYLVDAAGAVHLLEVNAYPDFAQTGADLAGLVSEVARDMVDVVVDAMEGSSKEVVGGFERVFEMDMLA